MSFVLLECLVGSGTSESLKMENTFYDLYRHYVSYSTEFPRDKTILRVITSQFHWTIINSLIQSISLHLRHKQMVGNYNNNYILKKVGQDIDEQSWTKNWPYVKVSEVSPSSTRFSWSLTRASSRLVAFSLDFANVISSNKLWCFCNACFFSCTKLIIVKEINIGTGLIHFILKPFFSNKQRKSK